ncbi:hypothetical protein TNCT_663461 [Trichonephila clavata]|nr:hypothetical protein TNCT_663461 [Trichonephila clavata]
MSCDGRRLFLKDNESPHRSAVATEWFKEHSYEFRTLSWPPNFPDNSIEHIFNVLQRVVLRSSPSRTTIA